jgi:hypothetical protein
MNRRSSIGFDRKIHLEWLDATAEKLATGATGAELRDFLFEYLSVLAGGRKHGSARAKTISVLSRIWLHVPEEAEPLRNRTLELLRTVQPSDRLVLHWAMTVAVYPFFTDVAVAVGRILGLQEAFSLNHVERRVAELWGERSTVRRTCQYVIRSMVEWGVLEDAGKGVYGRSGAARTVEDELAQLLVEAVLLKAENEALPLSQAAGHPALFPFDVRVSSLWLRKSDRVQVFRQGLDREFIILAD